MRATSNSVNSEKPVSSPPNPPCPDCDDVGWYIGWYENEAGEIIKQSITCTCAAGRAIIARRNKRLLELSSLPEDCRGWTFDGFRALKDLSEFQLAASETVEEFANNGVIDGCKGVYLHGSVGLGKSGLAAAAVNRATIAGNTALYLTVPDLLDHLRATYAPTAEVQYDELMDRIKDAELLVLDDFGTERTSQWAVEKLFQIVDHRNREGKRLIVTSNLTPTDLMYHLEAAASWTGRRIVDRIMQICLPVELTGENLRGGL